MIRPIGGTLLRKALGYLADFVYRNIAKKRKEAIDVMESVIRFSIGGGNFNEHVNTYFDSRFTPLLRPYLLDYTIAVVWEFIEKVEGDPNLINHLRGACDRLLVENPDNAALLMLRAYSRFLIPNYDSNDALNDLRKALDIFSTENKWSRKDHLLILSQLFDSCVKHDESTQDYLTLEIADNHKNWLRDFNKIFIEG